MLSWKQAQVNKWTENEGKQQRKKASVLEKHFRQGEWSEEIGAVLYQLIGLYQLIYLSFGNCWVIVMRMFSYCFVVSCFFSKEILKTVFRKLPHPLLSRSLTGFLGSFPHFVLVFMVWQAHPWHYRGSLLREKKAELCCPFSKAQVTVNGSLMWAGKLWLGTQMGKT